MTAVLGLALGVAAALIVLVMPIRTLESVTRLTGLAGLMVQAEPPISPADRNLLAALMAIVAAVIGWVLADWLLFGRMAMRSLFRAREDEFEDGDADSFGAADPLDLMASMPISHVGGVVQPGAPPPLMPLSRIMPAEPVPEMTDAELSNAESSLDISEPPEPAPPIVEPEPPAQPEAPPASQPRSKPSPVGTPPPPRPLPPAPAPAPAPPPPSPAPAPAVPVAADPAGGNAKLQDLLARFERGVQSRRAAATRGLPSPPPAQAVSVAPTLPVGNGGDALLDQPLHVTLEMLRAMTKR